MVRACVCSAANTGCNTLFSPHPSPIGCPWPCDPLARQCALLAIVSSSLIGVNHFVCLYRVCTVQGAGLPGDPDSPARIVLGRLEGDFIDNNNRCYYASSGSDTMVEGTGDRVFFFRANTTAYPPSPTQPPTVSTVASGLACSRGGRAYNEDHTPRCKRAHASHPWRTRTPLSALSRAKSRTSDSLRTIAMRNCAGLLLSQVDLEFPLVVADAGTYVVCLNLACVGQRWSARDRYSLPGGHGCRL